MARFNMRFLLLLSCFISCWIASASAAAQQAGNIRYGMHETYERLVFDWGKSIPYTIKQPNNGKVVLESTEKLTLNMSSVSSKIDNQSLTTINSLSVERTSPFSMTVQTNGYKNIRHFKLGNRIILDLYKTSEQIQKYKSEKKPASAPFKKQPNDNIKTEKSLKESQNSTNAMLKKLPAHVVVTEPLNQLQTKINNMQPHVITISAASAFGLAAFERAGFLWIVVDNPDIYLPPVINGPQSKSFPKFEKIQYQNAVAFRMPLPKNSYIYGEGGGLLWRLVITPNQRDVQPKYPQFSDDKKTVKWPLKSIEKKIRITDPLIGDEIVIVTTNQSEEIALKKFDYVDYDVLQSFAGFAAIPQSDSVQFITQDDHVLVQSSRGSLLFSDAQDTAEYFVSKTPPSTEKDNDPMLYNFSNWQMGGLKALEKNKQLLFKEIKDKTGSKKTESLLTLAKLHIANNRGQEALGLLELAALELPGIEETVEFISLHGVALALAYKYDQAILKLSKESLKEFAEVILWRSYTLAGLEDWQQAYNIIKPDHIDILFEYPIEIKQTLALELAEVALRSGDTDLAQKLLVMLDDYVDNMLLSPRSKWIYLSGELERQLGDNDQALEKWKKLVNGKDNYFRAKAGLSATRVKLETGQITPAKAIDNLEQLRYSWRGDELETLINFRLGKVYIENNNYLKGLSILRNAISLVPNSIMTEEVTDYMTEKFQSLFRDQKINDISALDAVSIYEEFKELTPPGKKGDGFIQNLAERLVNVDLLERATALLQHQVNHRLNGEDQLNTLIRLAAIQLLDNKPEGSLRSLVMAKEAISDIKTDTSKQRKKINLLSARALSKTGKSTQAMQILETMPKDNAVMRLQADIAWGAQKWGEAAAAFQDLLNSENISRQDDLNDYQTQLILNRAIALNLSNNRVGLANLKDRYGAQIEKTPKNRLFNLVTRPRQLGMLDNDNSVSRLINEVDLFGDFIDSYRKL